MTLEKIKDMREHVAAGNWTCIDVLALLDEVDALTARAEKAEAEATDKEGECELMQLRVAELQAVVKELTSHNPDICPCLSHEPCAKCQAALSAKGASHE